MKHLDTDKLSESYRRRAVDVPGQRLLITRLAGSAQEKDLTLPVNCAGLGRIRHFRRQAGHDWPKNPLPIDPVCRRLGLDPQEMLRAQVFQNAVCNWRCWYCFVPFALLSGDPKYSEWHSAEELLELYLAEETPPVLIDLSGGQPDLAPEWVPWMMRAIIARGLESRTYLWSDDNLSTDYFWRYLSETDRKLMAEYPTYSRVCCFKGYDPQSFSFNTRAAPSLFDRQFDLFAKLLTTGLDLYCYVTLTGPPDIQLRSRIQAFVDRLQELDELLPLRTVPLEITAYEVMAARLGDAERQAMATQWEAAHYWTEALEERFNDEVRGWAICDVPLRLRGGAP